MATTALKRNAREAQRVRQGVEVAGLSDVGCQRENNEDRFAYWEPGNEQTFLHKGRLAIIADGMGGQEGGQEASRVAVETIEKFYAETPDGDPRSLLYAAFQTAHQSIRQFAGEHPWLSGMGTTATAIALVGHELYYSHVGDSRLYLARQGSLSRITRDQSYVGRLVEQGIISPEEAGSHPQRNVLTAALGAGAEVVPESAELPIAMEAGDVLLLCTDGLWGVVKEDEILDIVSSQPPEQACRQLVDLAKQRGGPDNITLQIIRIA
jgi:PPM family protein phosphatase